MVAPPSFDNPILPLSATSRPGAVSNSGTLQTATRRPDTSPTTNEAGAPATRAAGQSPAIRGDRPASPNLSTPFVAQFIAQEIDPSPARPRDPVETTRAFDAFRQAIASAAALDEPTS